MKMRFWIRNLFTPPVTRPIRKATRPSLEVLEDRWCPATFTVDRLDGDSQGTDNSGSLRYCADKANSTGGEDTIVFDTSVFGTAKTIHLAGTGQLELTDTALTTITGPGAALLTVDGGHVGGLNRVIGIGVNAKAQLSGLTITGGTELSGAGVLIDSGATGTLIDCIITGNTADVFGGGVSNRGTAVLTNCTISGNNAVHHGGGVNNSGVATLTNCSIANNHVGPNDYGGGLYSSGSIALKDCTIVGNTAGRHGGGMYSKDVDVTIDSCTFSNNEADPGDHNYYGGGLYLESNTATLTNCTFTNNKAKFGGALYVYTGTANLKSCTFVSNTAQYGGGVYIDRSSPTSVGTVSAQNTILAFNTATYGENDVYRYSNTTFTSLGNNLFGAGFGEDSTSSDLILKKEEMAGQQKLLTNLGDFGGSTQTRALLPGSKAIGKGAQDGVTTDQRGFSRNGKVDIGAFQTPNGWNGPEVSLEVNSTGDSGLSGKLSLRQAVNLFNVLNRGTAITFNASVFGTVQTIVLTHGQLELVNDPGARQLRITAPTAGLTISGNFNGRVFQIDAQVEAKLEGLTITAGSADSGGGLLNQGTVTLNACTIIGNTASNTGGGLGNLGKMTLNNCTIIANGSQDNNFDITVKGAGLYSAGPTLDLNNCLISDNNTLDGGTGGGVLIASGTVTMTNCTISDNYSENGVGGLQITSGTVTLTRCTISGNKSDSGSANGAGLLISGNAAVTLTNSTISGNHANANGGGVMILDTTATAKLTNCTISGNSANGGGGGIYTKGTLFLTNCTISGNAAGPDGGGGLLHEQNAPQTILTNTIVAGNSTDVRAESPSLKGTYNLIGNGAGSPFADNIDGNIVGHPAGLAPLDCYGGPTKTMALLPGSRARDSGTKVDGLTKDQRGFAREKQRPDIGAFESQSRPLVVTTTTDASAVPLGKLDLRGAINLANVMSGPQEITFDATVFANAQTITLTAGQLDLKDTGGIQRITGPKAGVTISGGGHSRVFEVQMGVTANLSNLAIVLGIAPAGDGAGLLNHGTVNLVSCTISGNVAGGNGGGLANFGTANLGDCLFSNNSAVNGGGLYNAAGGTANLDKCLFSTNNATGNGGGLFNAHTLTISASTLSGNMAHDGGGLFNDNHSAATLINCTLFGNQATHRGGGVYNNSTVAVLSLKACTVSGNSADADTLAGGGLYSGGTLDLNITIVASNTKTSSPTTASDIDGLGVNSGSTYNLIGTGGSGGLANGVDGNIVGVTTDQLKLAPLGNYNGPTVGAPGSAQVLPTMALLPCSLAIGMGGTPLADVTTDERGLPRGAIVDIGAFQVSLLVKSTAGSVITTPSQLTLAGAVSLGNTFGGTTIISFDPAVFTGGQTITLDQGPLALTKSSAISFWTIKGPANGVTIRGGQNKVFRVDAGVTASIANLTIMSGVKAPGDGLTVTGTVDVSNSNFINAGIRVIKGAAATIKGGQVTGNGTGIVVGTDAKDTATAMIHGVDLSGNKVGVKNNGKGHVDARLNWWGSEAGPTDDKASPAVGDVDYSPWLGDADSLHLATPSSLGFTVTGKQYEVTPVGGTTPNPSLSIMEGGVSSPWTVMAKGIIWFVGKGGSVKVNGPSGAGFETNIFTVDGGVSFHANDPWEGAVISTPGSTMLEVVAHGTTNFFNVSSMDGAAKLTAPPGSNSTVQASKKESYTLTDTSLKSTDGMNLTLTGITVADLHIVTTKGDPALIVDASAFTGATFLTAEGTGRAILFGGGSNTTGSTLKAQESVNAVLIGGAGANTLTDTGTGTSILIGGGGASTTDPGNSLTGNGNDILISGNTIYDSNTKDNIDALKKILTAWSSKADSYKERIDKIASGVGPKRYKLNDNTVQANGKANMVDALQDPFHNWLFVDIATDTFIQQDEVVTIIT